MPQAFNAMQLPGFTGSRETDNDRILRVNVTLCVRRDNMKSVCILRDSVIDDLNLLNNEDASVQVEGTSTYMNFGTDEVGTRIGRMFQERGIQSGSGTNIYLSGEIELL